ncbi:hypothetical protein CHCC20441_3384 [Bacillus licheniformis]|uniref:Uncharacterized protein n=1 Tax=Bacillus licheniformis TaxID=1402 RepID=A0A415J1Y8_BACLI|nr:hypothetical protein BLi01618 [Bacillus licheniformis DSM 13 = ATCC 14580]APJ26718.1 hypothetical protein BSZ43_07915 [Bacillus sp. H15-1]ASV15093.1 hypothetical protein CJO35_07980 [Bacillus sp. 1s-1]ATI75776.1 hypothetical protein CPQ91_07965 [Bacillus licheniformis]MBY8346290.1 hypothetical protein [Bacillus sp. PCH94]TWN17159.1 hypothetical protein CHCC14564_1724 [Bacillus licheniformis LMG 17339]
MPGLLAQNKRHLHTLSKNIPAPFHPIPIKKTKLPQPLSVYILAAEKALFSFLKRRCADYC